MSYSTRIVASVLFVIGTLSCGSGVSEPTQTHDHGCDGLWDPQFGQYAQLAGYHEDQRGCPGAVPVNGTAEAGGLIRDLTADYQENTSSVSSAFLQVFDHYTSPAPGEWPCASALSNNVLGSFFWDDQFGPQYWMTEMYISYQRDDAPDLSCFKINIYGETLQGHAWVYVTYTVGDPG